MDRLFINGQEVDKWDKVNGLGGEEDDLCLELPTYQLVDKSKMDKWIADVDQSDADALEAITRLDCDKYVGKKIKLMITVLGSATRQGR